MENGTSFRPAHQTMTGAKSDVRSDSLWETSAFQIFTEHPLRKTLDFGWLMVLVLALVNAGLKKDTENLIDEVPNFASQGYY